MKLIDSFGYALSTIKERKLRSFLTILGVLIGIAAIVAMNAMSGGFQSEIEQQFETGFSTNTLTVSSGGFGGMGGMGETGDSVPLFINDSVLIEGLDNVELVTPIMQNTVEAKIDGTVGYVSIYGVDFTVYSQIYSTFITQVGEIPENTENFTIIGENIADPNSTGEFIVSLGNNVSLSWSERIGPVEYIYHNASVEIAGILDTIGGFSLLGAPSDSAIYVDLKTYQEIFDTNEISMIIIKITDTSTEAIDKLTLDIQEALGEEVSVIAMDSLLGTVGTMLDTMTIFLSAVAGISLIVAGVGIMNIMTVSLMERTREIGILKAIGLKDNQLLGTFVIETLIIGIIGSAGGIGIGYLLADIFLRVISGFTMGGDIGGGNRPSFSSAFSPVLTPQTIILALAFGIGISVLFGLFAARNAAKKSPVEALRYE